MAGNKKKRILICLMIIALLILAVALLIPKGKSVKLDRAEETDILGDVHTLNNNNNKELMENAVWKLEVDEETLALTLTNKENGKVLETSKDYTEGNDIWNAFCASGITLEFYSGNSTVANKVSLSKEKADIELQYYSDGFDANIAYDNYDFAMQLQVRLLEDGISVYVPGGSIHEGEEYLLGSVWLYPMLGATYLGEKAGYMVIPEGSGALIDLEDHQGKYKNPYVKRIYGGNVGTDAAETNSYGMPVVTEPKSIQMPIFGMVYTAEEIGFLGVVTQGDTNAYLTAYPNGVTTPFNWVTAQFMVRDVYTKQTAKTSGVPTFETKGDIRNMGMRYFFLEGEDADYTGIAKTYQKYLVEQDVLKKREDTFRMKLDFLGADSKKWFLFDTLVPMTTVKDMDAILEDLIGENVTNLRPTYFGWQEDGVTRNYGSTDVGLESALGSVKDLMNLREKAAANGMEFTLQTDYLLANASRLYNTTTDIVKGINQVIVEVPTYQKLFPKMYYQTPKYSMELLQDFKKSKLGQAGFDLEISGITDHLFSYYSAGETFTRLDTAAQYHQLFDALELEAVGMETPGAYLWEKMDCFYDMPLTTSGYQFISKEVPILPIVLRGYVPYWATYTNFEANETESFLKLLEYGAYPTFLVTGEPSVELRNTNSSYIYTSEYSVLKDRILQYDAKVGEALSKVEGAGIVSHKYLADQVVEVTYDNGVMIWINYGADVYDEEGVTVPALSYVVKEESGR